MIVFISCGKKKLKTPAKAEDLYQGGLFKLALKVAKKRGSKVYILSAKYGLLNLDDLIAPYEKTLLKMTKQEKEAWYNKINSMLISRGLKKKDEVVSLCSSEYQRPLVEYFSKVIQPLNNLSLGFRMKRLKEMSL